MRVFLIKGWALFSAFCGLLLQLKAHDPRTPRAPLCYSKSSEASNWPPALHLSLRLKDSRVRQSLNQAACWRPKVPVTFNSSPIASSQLSPHRLRARGTAACRCLDFLPHKRTATFSSSIRPLRDITSPAHLCLLPPASYPPAFLPSCFQDALALVGSRLHQDRLRFLEARTRRHPLVSFHHATCKAPAMVTCSGVLCLDCS